MLRFLNLARLVKTESSITRQPSILLTRRDLSGSNWLEQAQNGKSRKGSSKGTKSGKGISGGGGGSFGKGKGGSKSSGSKGGLFGGGKLWGSQSHSQPQSSSSSSPSSVCFDKNSNRFTLDLGNNQVARIDFKSIGRNKIELYHTEVPNELRGRGIGKALAKGALEQAARNNVKVKLSCSYLINNLDKFADAKLRKVVEEK